MAASEKRSPAGQGEASRKVIEQSDPNNTPAPRTRQARWMADHPVARWSHVAVASAIRRGILSKPDACEACGKAGPLDAHHEDHRLALDVRWWCRACHVAHHARARKAGRDG